MKFTVSRTSIYDGKPCDEAQQMIDKRVETKTFNSPLSDSWFAFGINHRTENGVAVRDRVCQYWMIELDTLDQLETFIQTHGKVVISDIDYHDTGLLDIEIYDTYRE